MVFGQRGRKSHPEQIWSALPQIADINSSCEDFSVGPIRDIGRRLDAPHPRSSTGRLGAFGHRCRVAANALPSLTEQRINDQEVCCVPLESVREHQTGLQSFRSMRRIDARRRNASAFRFRFSQSFASRRQRLSQAIVRSTTQRRGSTTNPLV